MSWMCLPIYVYKLIYGDVLEDDVSLLSTFDLERERMIQVHSKVNAIHQMSHADIILVNLQSFNWETKDGIKIEYFLEY